MRFTLVVLPTDNPEKPAFALELIEGDAVFSISNKDGQPVPDALSAKIQELIALIKEKPQWQQ
jgi:hypothetical protein